MSKEFPQFSELPADVRRVIQSKATSKDAVSFRETAKEHAANYKPNTEGELLLNIIKAIEAYVKHSTTRKQIKDWKFSMRDVSVVNVKRIKYELATYKKNVMSGQRMHEKLAKMTPEERGDFVVKTFVKDVDDDVKIKDFLEPLEKMIAEFGKKAIIFDDVIMHDINYFFHSDGLNQYNEVNNITIDDPEQVYMFNLVNSMRSPPISGGKSLRKR